MDHQDWPKEIPPCLEVPVPELKKTIAAFPCTSSRSDIFTRFSSLTRLKRVTAYCLQFKFNTLSKSTKKSGPLSSEELEQATDVLVRMVQSEEFALERSDLQINKGVQSKSRLLPLNPFLDAKEILRVGGRLRHFDGEYS